MTPPAARSDDGRHLCSKRLQDLLAFDQTCARRAGDPSHDSATVARGLPSDPPPVGTVAGFDEAGRGSLAGPVVVGCVHFDWNRLFTAQHALEPAMAEALARLDDSKRVTARRREQLFDAITTVARWGVGCASAREIDRLGIVTACRLAALRAWQRLGVEVDQLLFDRGLSLPGPAADRQPPHQEITQGDGQSMHIAAASIVAKVSRDQLMRQLAVRAPGYGLETHKGYGTVAHGRALRLLGPSRFHRRTFLGEER